MSHVPVAVVAVALALLILWGVSSSWVAAGVLARDLRAVARALSGLGLREVATPQEHAQMVERADQLAVGYPLVGEATSAFLASVVVLDGRPRAVAHWTQFLDLTQVDVRRGLPWWVIGTRARAALPGRVARLGAACALALAVALSTVVGPAESWTAWTLAVDGLAVQAGVPLGVGLGGSVLLRVADEQGAARLERASWELQALLGGLYRSVSSQELLARILTALTDRRA